MNAAIAALLNGVEGALDTLKEFANAMADDANFAASMKTVFAATASLTAHLADYVRQPGFAPSTGGVANTYAAATTPALPALADGGSIYLDVQVANTGASTLNWDGKGAKVIVDAKGAELVAGKMPLMESSV